MVQDSPKKPIDLLAAASRLAAEKAGSIGGGRGLARYKLEPYRDQLRELLIRSPLSISAIAKLLSDNGVTIGRQALQAYLEREFPEEFAKYKARTRPTQRQPQQKKTEKEATQKKESTTKTKRMAERFDERLS